MTTGSRRVLPVVAVGVVVLGLGLAVVLSLSDRVPGLAVDLAEALGIDGALKRFSPRHDPWLVAHATGWAMLSFAVTVPAPRWPRRLLAAGGAWVLSLAIEQAQELASQHRSFSLEDIAANTVGITVGLVASSLWWQVRRRRPHP